MAKVDKSINPVLIETIDLLLKDVKEHLNAEEGEEKKYSLTDVMKVLDRAIGLEKIKQKIDDESWGAGFAEEEEETDDQRG